MSANDADVTLVRIYWHESLGNFHELIQRLHDVEKVRGVTVFRGIAGYGSSGQMHESTLVDLSLDLPVVIEFFDTPERAAEVIADLRGAIKPGHIVSWPARVTL